MKLMLIVLLVFMIMLIAYAVSEQYKDKYDFYENLHNFLCQFKINLSFKQEKIIEFLNSINSKRHFKIFIQDYKDYLQTEKLSFNNLTFLEQEEIMVLEDIIKNLGNHDVNTELQQMDGFILLINNKKEQTLKDKNKLCPLILKLSFLFAVGLAILLI